MRVAVLFMAVPIFVLVACASGGAGSDPAETVERYIQAKVESDRDAVQGLLCAEMERDLEREAASFSGVEARLEGVDCTFNQDASTVTCTGEIVATYGGEDRSFPLTTYRVTQEDGEWKWCGEG
jgi:hypothetical protein